MHNETNKSIKNHWTSYTWCRVQGLLVDIKIWFGTPRLVRREEIGSDCLIVMKHANSYKAVKQIPFEDLIEYYTRQGYTIKFDSYNERKNTKIFHGILTNKALEKNKQSSII